VRSVLVQDPDVYHDDPLRFYPERFMNEDLSKPLAGHWAFGAGRRGIHNTMGICFESSFPFAWLRVLVRFTVHPSRIPSLLEFVLFDCA
jgi:Cytochrome P450